MTPEEALAALRGSGEYVGLPFSTAARNRAASKARMALSRMYPDDYRALCVVALEQELSK